MTEWLLLLASLALVLACGGFVAAEFAFVTVDRSSVLRQAQAGDARSAGLLRALTSLSTQLSGAQLGITVTNLAIGFLAEPALAALLRGPLQSLGVPSAGAHGVAVTLALVLATAVTMIYGELVPKNLAIAHPLATGRAVQRYQRAFTAATRWPIVVLNSAANAILRRAGVEPREELASARSAQELASLVSRSAEKGALAGETATLLQRSLAFSSKRANDVLTPRTRMHTVDGRASADDVIALTRQTGHSRFPVVAGDVDDVVGVVHVKHAVAVPDGERHSRPVEAVMSPSVRVPATLALDDLLRVLRASPLQIAVVVDEFGGTDGLVTVEDLVEELVGEVIDEHDPQAARARRSRDGTWLLSGLLRPDEVRALTGVALPEDRSYETVAGLVGQRLGRTPTVGATVELPGGRLTVTQMVGRRAARIRLTPASSANSPSDAVEPPTSSGSTEHPEGGDTHG